MSYNPFDDFEDKPAGGAGFSNNVAEVAETKPKVQLNVVEVIPTKDEKDLKIELLEKHILELYETLMIPHYNNKISSHTIWITNQKALIESLKKQIESNIKSKDEGLDRLNLLIRDMKARQELFKVVILHYHTKSYYYCDIEKITKDIIKTRNINYLSPEHFGEIVTGAQTVNKYGCNIALTKQIKINVRSERLTALTLLSEGELIISKELVFEVMNEKIKEYNECIARREKYFVEEDERLKKLQQNAEENLIQDEEILMKEIKDCEDKIRKIKDGLF